ncbi:MAG: hypothetical protein LBG48_04965, partial [Rickettsiales bacterium]|jgi:hypothetical protein|nr:hypothetical protein [Rickettsiales bacterium]
VSDFQSTNNLILSGLRSSLYQNGVFAVREAKSLLDKLDDGSPNTGLVRACEFDVSTNTSCEQAATLTIEGNTNLYALVSKLDF